MLLGIDLGTGSVKALLLTSEGVTVASGHAGYPVGAPRPGWAETEPEAWWRSTVSAVRQAVAGHEHHIAAIGLSGQMHGVVIVDGTGRPVRPAILWADGRASKQLARYRALPRELQGGLANRPTSGIAGPTLLWLQEHEGDNYARARWALQPKDWLRYVLTGLPATDPSDASATLLYDVAKDSWAEPVVSALGLRFSLLPQIVPSSAMAGRLTPQSARELGLPAGLPVATGAADTAAAALGSGLIGAGQMQLTIGTGAQLIAPSEHKTPDPSGRSHLFRSATPDGYYAMAAMQNAGLALEWVLRNLGAGWEEAYEIAFTVPAGAEGVTFVPYVTGERTPHFDPDACGSWRGLRLYHTRAHLLRAAFEGVAFSIREGWEVLRSLGYDAPYVRVAGGGSLNPTWRQLLADVLARPLMAADVSAASARGAAILAGHSVGAFGGDAGEVISDTHLELVATPADAEALYEPYERFLAAYDSRADANDHA